MKRGVVLCAVPLLALAACAGPSASAQPQPSPPAGQRSYWPHQQALTDAADVADETGRDRWPDRYAGVEVDVPGNVLVVHRVAPAAELDAALRALAGGAAVRFVDAAYPARVLDGWAERVRGDLPYWQRRGVVVYAVAVDVGRCVGVEVDNPGRDAAAIVGRYPGAAVCVSQGAAAEPLTVGG